MLKIGEFSILSSISIPMLRNYDKLGLLMPRGVDNFTGYRYYDPEQLITANRIIALKCMGFGLKEIKCIDLHMADEAFRRIMRQKYEEKEAECLQIKKQLDRIREVLENATPREYTYAIAVKEMPERKMACVRNIIHAFPEEGRLWETLFRECQISGTTLPENHVSMAIQHTVDFEKSEFDVEVLTSIEKAGRNTEALGFRIIPACTAASMIFKGSYHQLSEINLNIARWLQRNQYEVCGSQFILYHISPGQTPDENQFVTEICFPVKQRLDSHTV